MKKQRLMLVAVLAPLAVAGCDLIDDLLKPPPVACPAIACLTQATIELKPTSGTLPSGTHEALVTRDRLPPVRCTFSWPPAPNTGPFVHATCDDPPSPMGRIFLSVGPVQRCGPVRQPDGGSLGSSCELVPGELVERLSIPGTPAHVRLVQSAGGSTYFDRSFDLTYKDVYRKDDPCYQDCKQAHVEGSF